MRFWRMQSAQQLCIINPAKGLHAATMVLPRVWVAASIEGLKRLACSRWRWSRVWMTVLGWLFMAGVDASLAQFVNR